MIWRAASWLGERRRGVMTAIDGEPIINGGWFFVAYLYSDLYSDPRDGERPVTICLSAIQLSVEQLDVSRTSMPGSTNVKPSSFADVD